MTVRAGLIGYGLAGRVFHAPLLQAAGISIDMVASSRGAEITRDLPQARVVKDPLDVATSSDVGLVVIGSPNDTHFSLAMAALETGHAVVIDKPFAQTVAEADKLIATAQAYGCLLSVFHNRRWDSDFKTLKESIRRGDIGEVVSYQCRFDRFRPEVADRWREKALPGVGLLYDLGPHLVDQALQLFGWPDWLVADLNKQREGTVVDDGFLIRMGKGKLRITLGATLMAAAAEPKFVVHGTRGSFLKVGIDMQEDQLKAGLRPGDKGFGREPEDTGAVLTTVNNGKAESTRLPTLPGDYAAYYVGIRDALEIGSPLPVTAEQARDSMVILEAACQSYGEGTRISLSR